MRIVILTTWFSERMGYIENCLPKALAQLGHEVHVVTSTAQVYYNSREYKEVYEPFLGKNILNEGVKQVDGFTLHRIPFINIGNKVCLQKLGRKLKEIHPDVVQVFETVSITSLQATFYKFFFNYKLFTANHTVASVFPLYQPGKNGILNRILFFVVRTIPGKLISLFISRCFPATVDALDIAVNYYGVPKEKVKLASLGVDTDFFCPTPANKEALSIRENKRKELGVFENEILCIYTGRFTEGKNPLLLAKAIDKLVKSKEPFKALFMGNGFQLNEIKKCKGCIVHEFIPYHQLPEFYNIADVGVWPKQESTSMIDAAACGVPIIISNRVQAIERVEGNGLTYIENDIDDLVNVLLKMKDKQLRKKFSEYGINKIQNSFSWKKIALDRIEDYNEFIEK